MMGWSKGSNVMKAKIANLFKIFFRITTTIKNNCILTCIYFELFHSSFDGGYNFSKYFTVFDIALVRVM